MVVLSSVIISQTACKLPLNVFFHHSRLQNQQNRKTHFLFVHILITDFDPAFTFHFSPSVCCLTLTEFLQ